MTEKQWVAAGTASGELQAELLRGLLEAQGIPARLSQEGLARVYGFTVGPMAEVEILVPDHQLSEALAVLESYKAGDFELDDEDIE